jgi:hypothetical protein
MTVITISDLGQAILYRLAASRDGLTTTDLEDLGDAATIGGYFSRLAARGLVRDTGRKLPAVSESGLGARRKVRAITQDGLEVLGQIELMGKAS